MKKILALILAVVMLFTMSVIAFADDATITKETPEGKGEAIVQTSMYKDEQGTDAAENFTVTYPAVTTIYWGTEETKAEYTIEAQLEWNHRLTVNVAAKSAAMTSANTNKTLDYTLSGDTAVQTDDAVASETKTLTFTVIEDDWKAVPVDVYADTVTFMVAVVSAE